MGGNGKESTRQEVGDHSQGTAELEPSRRDVLKSAGVAATGALGTLDGDAESNSGSQETVTISFLTPDPTESTRHRDFYQEQMGRFEDRDDNVQVDLQTMPWGTLWESLVPMAENENLPDLATSGPIGYEFHTQGRDVLLDHSTFIEEAEGLPENIHASNQEIMDYRGEYWSGGGHYIQTTLMAIRPKFFKEVGVEDPSELETWTGFRRALEEIDSQTDVIAFEETGATGDLESYWGEARTAYSGGEDPWLDVTDQGSPDDPYVKIGQEPRTDGMIKNVLDNADAYSSEEVASRTDEDVPPLLLTDRVASFPHALGRAQRWIEYKSDVSFGWDGDVMILPYPRLDENYGDEFGIEELAGRTGQTGGNAWGFDLQHTVFNSTSSPEKAWELLDYVCRDREFVLPYLGEVQSTAPSTVDLFDDVRNEFDMPQPQQTVFDVLDEWPQQYKEAGAAWDTRGLNSIRVNSISEPLSQALAGQIDRDDAPNAMRERVQEAIQSA